MAKTFSMPLPVTFAALGAALTFTACAIIDGSQGRPPAANNTTPGPNNTTTPTNTQPNASANTVPNNQTSPPEMTCLDDATLCEGDANVCLTLETEGVERGWCARTGDLDAVTLPTEPAQLVHTFDADSGTFYVATADFDAQTADREAVIASVAPLSSADDTFDAPTLVMQTFSGGQEGGTDEPFELHDISISDAGDVAVVYAVSNQADDENFLGVLSAPEMLTALTDKPVFFPEMLAPYTTPGDPVFAAHHNETLMIYANVCGAPPTDRTDAACREPVILLISSQALASDSAALSGPSIGDAIVRFGDRSDDLFIPAGLTAVENSDSAMRSFVLLVGEGGDGNHTARSYIDTMLQGGGDVDRNDGAGLALPPLSMTDRDQPSCGGDLELVGVSSSAGDPVTRISPLSHENFLVGFPTRAMGTADTTGAFYRVRSQDTNRRLGGWCSGAIQDGTRRVLAVTPVDAFESYAGDASHYILTTETYDDGRVTLTLHDIFTPLVETDNMATTVDLEGVTEVIDAAIVDELVLIYARTEEDTLRGFALPLDQLTRD